MEKGICLIERLYVPYGQTVRFETLRVDKLIVTETSLSRERYLP